MAGMFYSLQEAAERLGKTEDEIRAIVQAGQLREFRDGPNLLFKVDEVEALMLDSGVAAVQGAPQPQIAPPQPPVPQVAPPPVPELEIPQDEIPLELDIPQAEPAAPQPEIPLEPETPQVFEPAEPELDIPLELDVPQAETPPIEMPQQDIPQAPAPEFEAPVELEAPQMEIPELEIPDAASPEGEIPAELGAPQMEMPEAAVPEFEIPSELEAPEMGMSDLEIPELEVPTSQGPPTGTSEILLAPETGAPVAPSELTNADTAIGGEGINVLGETDKDYAITDDTLGETVGSLGLASTGTTPDASLEEIEGDVNLDSFGSGSGLLDLSLQADDTSLGGILDEIYTAEDEAVEPADPGTVAEVAAEADQMAADDELLVPQGDLALPGLAHAYFEPEPDKASNILGAMLFVPLLFVLYTAIVAVGGLKGVAPSLLVVTQGFIWYIVIGFTVVTAGIGLYAVFMADKEPSPAAKKAKKPKKPRKPKKPKKPKKAKK